MGPEIKIEVTIAKQPSNNEKITTQLTPAKPFQPEEPYFDTPLTDLELKEIVGWNIHFQAFGKRPEIRSPISDRTRNKLLFFEQAIPDFEKLTKSMLNSFDQAEERTEQDFPRRGNRS